MKTVTRNNGFFPSIFDEFFPENKLDVSNYETFSIPSVNIKENFTTFDIDLAVPGLKKENFDIELLKNVLTVSSKAIESTNEVEKEDVKFSLKEFNYGSFKRTFALPETVNIEDIKAAYKDGILNISIPKKEEAKNIKRMVEIS